MNELASVGAVRFEPKALSKGRSRGAPGAVTLVGSERRSIRHHIPGATSVAVSAPRAPGEGRTRAMTFGAQPNQRLKLAAPVLSRSGDAPMYGVVEFRL